MTDPTAADREAAEAALNDFMSSRGGEYSPGGRGMFRWGFFAGIAHARKTREADETAAYLLGYAKAKDACAAEVAQLVEALERARKYHDWNECDDTIEAGRVIDALLVHHKERK